jgi:hypothetical protein
MKYYGLPTPAVRSLAAPVVNINTSHAIPKLSRFKHNLVSENIANKWVAIFLCLQKVRVQHLGTKPATVTEGFRAFTPTPGCQIKPLPFPSTSFPVH